uniref:Ig-like domain-containing protein n=1 Tax=Steinernema glaseri TaxID=37863 RepID=A0A1I7ZPW6_9BILA
MENFMGQNRRATGKETSFPKRSSGNVTIRHWILSDALKEKKTSAFLTDDIPLFSSSVLFREKDVKIIYTPAAYYFAHGTEAKKSEKNMTSCPPFQFTEVGIWKCLDNETRNIMEMGSYQCTVTQYTITLISIHLYSVHLA